MLRVEVHDASNTTWLQVEGRFVGAFAEDTKAMVVRCKLPSHLVVDLSEVTFVDAEGEEVLLWLACIGAQFVNPLTGTRPYPAFGQIDWRGTRNNSNYEALSIAVKRSFSRGLLLSINYAWSHEIDDGSNGSGVRGRFCATSSARRHL
jgi:hypothetical protein